MQKKIVHRDLKPENVLLIKNENQEIIDCKICDLGLGKQLQENFPEFFTQVGTEMYKAPELRDDYEFVGTKYTDKVDVYSFGLILHFMLFGNHAYYMYDKSEFIKGNFTISKDYLAPNTSNEYKYFTILIQSCLAKNPVDRITFAQILNNDFFSSIKIPEFPNDFDSQMLIKIRDGSSSTGYYDPGKKRYLKIYYKDNLQSNFSLKYLKREIEFLLKSKNTPHIVKFLQYGLSQNGIIFAFEYCNGENLQKCAEKRGIKLSDLFLNISQRFFFKEITIIARSLIEFIDDMHGRNYLHRSINLKHILIIEDKGEISEIKVSGFKSSKSENNDLQSLIPSPEVVKFSDPLAVSEGFCEESDLWSIGMVIYFMTFGKLPANKFNELKAIRDKGILIFPNSKDYPNLQVDETIKTFILFCIAKRKLGELSGKLLVDILKPNIPWFN